MCGCFTCMKDMSVPPLCHESMEARRVNRSPGTGIKTLVIFQLGRHWESNPGLLEEHPVFLTTDPTLQPWDLIFSQQTKQQVSSWPSHPLLELINFLICCSSSFLLSHATGTSPTPTFPLPQYVFDALSTPSWEPIFHLMISSVLASTKSYCHLNTLI